jgi:hypothetical protein
MNNIITKPNGVSPGRLETTLKTLDAGTLKDFPAKTSIMIAGTAMTPAQIDTTIQGYLATIDAVAPAKQAYQKAVANRKAITVAAQTFCDALKTAVIALLGKQSAQLADFGLKPAKAKVITGAAMVTAAAKAKLTKTLRGTTSKKQKQTLVAGVSSATVTVANGAVSATLAPPSGSNASSTATSTAASGTSTPASTAGSSTPSGS